MKYNKKNNNQAINTTMLPCLSSLPPQRHPGFETPCNGVPFFSSPMQQTHGITKLLLRGNRRVQLLSCSIATLFLKKKNTKKTSISHYHYSVRDSHYTFFSLSSCFSFESLCLSVLHHSTCLYVFLC